MMGKLHLLPSSQSPGIIFRSAYAVSLHLRPIPPHQAQRGHIPRGLKTCTELVEVIRRACSSSMPAFSASCWLVSALSTISSVSGSRIARETKRPRPSWMARGGAGKADNTETRLTPQGAHHVHHRSTELTLKPAPGQPPSWPCPRADRGHRGRAPRPHSPPSEGGAGGG